MAGDWIKMRPGLLISPKINGIARILESDPVVANALSTGFAGCMSEIVKRNVMRNVTVGALLAVWGAANEHTSDGVFKNADLDDIDDIAGIPHFATAMRSVGWLEYDEDKLEVKLPNFSEYNTCGRDRAAERNAERQRKYRERKKSESNATHNVTRDVTNNGREEKRREDNNNTRNATTFALFWDAYPRKVDKQKAKKKWHRLAPSQELVDRIIADIEFKKESEWRDTQFIPYPTTYLNGARWEDESPAEAREVVIWN